MDKIGRNLILLASGLTIVIALNSKGLPFVARMIKRSICALFKQDGGQKSLLLSSDSDTDQDQSELNSDQEEDVVQRENSHISTDNKQIINGQSIDVSEDSRASKKSSDTSIQAMGICDDDFSDYEILYESKTDDEPLSSW